MFEKLNSCLKYCFCQFSNLFIFLILVANILLLYFFKVFVKNVATLIMQILTFFNVNNLRIKLI